MHFHRCDVERPVRRGTVLLVLIVLASLSSNAAAQTCTQWVERLVSGPNARHSAAMAYDSARGVVVLFGGTNNVFAHEGDTWEWDGTTWTQVATTGPLARSGHAMTYDAARGEVVLFGGVNWPAGNLQDTWAWDGSSWTQRASSGPSPRAFHAMAYDAARQRVVLFGGTDGLAGTSETEETWEWDGSSWTLRSTVGPTGRYEPAMVYNGATQRILMTGGGLSGTSPGESDDIWEWDGGTWVQRVLTGPGLISSPSMVYDSARGLTVLFEGDETWEYDGTSWAQSQAAGPVDRYLETMAYDSARGVTVLFGGDDFAGSPFLGDTWELTPDPLPAPTNAAANPPGLVCPGYASTLSASVPAGQTVDWYTGSCGGLYVGTGATVTVSPSATTTYYARAREIGTGCLSGQCAEVTLPVISSGPAAPTGVTASTAATCAGNPVTLSASVPSGQTVDWYKGDCGGGTYIGSGATITINPLATTTFQARARVVATGCRSANCGTITVTIFPAAKPPSSVLISPSVFCASDPGVITLTAVGGTGQAVYWFEGECGGTPIAVGNPITRPSPTVTTTYHASWMDACGQRSDCTSATATAITAPLITQQPVDVGVCAGGSAVFTVSATGSGPLGYQWRKGAQDLTDGPRISGSQTATLTIDPVEAADAGKYSVVVTDACGSTISQTAPLSIITVRVTGILGAYPPQLQPTTGGFKANFVGRAFTSGMTVVFSTPFYSVQADPAGVVADPTGMFLSVVVPAFPPGCDCGNGQPILADVLFANDCGSDTLSAHGLSFRYDPAIVNVSFPDSVQAAIDAAAPGTCVVLEPQRNHLGPVVIGSDKRDITITSDPATFGENRIAGQYQGQQIPPDAAITFDACGPNICMSNLALILGNSGAAVLNGSEPWIKRCQFDNNFADATRGGGLTIASGSSPAIVLSEILVNVTSGDGGGVRIEDASATIVRSTIRSNGAPGNGGGVYINGTAGVLLADNAIWFNSDKFTGATSQNGGGVYIGSPTQIPAVPIHLIRNDIWANPVTGDGAAIYLDANVAPLISENVIHENYGTSPGSEGGGLYVKPFNFNQFTVCENVFYANSAQVGGAAALLNKAEPDFVRNLVFCNAAVQNDTVTSTPHLAGGIYMFDANPLIEHNTIYKNSGTNLASQGGGIHGQAMGTGNPFYWNNILMRNEGFEIWFSAPVINPGSAPRPFRVDYNIVYDDPPLATQLYRFASQGPSNIIADPLFVGEPGMCESPYPGIYNPWTDAFALAEGSPAIGTASDGLDRGAVVSDGFEPGSCTPVGPGDCNGNGVPDLIDILAGTSADTNRNGAPDECEQNGPGTSLGEVAAGSDENGEQGGPDRGGFGGGDPAPHGARPGAREISVFLKLYLADDPAADVNRDGRIDQADISAYLSPGSAGPRR